MLDTITVHPELLDFWTTKVRQIFWCDDDVNIQPETFTKCPTIHHLQRKLLDSEVPVGTGYHLQDLFFCCIHPGWNTWLTFRGRQCLGDLRFIAQIKRGNFQQFIDFIHDLPEDTIDCDIQPAFEAKADALLKDATDFIYETITREGKFDRRQSAKEYKPKFPNDKPFIPMYRRKACAFDYAIIEIVSLFKGTLMVNGSLLTRKGATPIYHPLSDLPDPDIRVFANFLRTR